MRAHLTSVQRELRPMSQALKHVSFASVTTWFLTSLLLAYQACKTPFVVVLPLIKFAERCPQEGEQLDLTHDLSWNWFFLPLLSLCTL